MTPRLTFVNSSRVHLGREMIAFAKRTKAGMLVLDAGAGKSPYKNLFNHARYEAADFAEFDTAICSLGLRLRSHRNPGRG